jgi:feruloyl esterase
MAFASDPGPSWSPADFDAERDAPRLRFMEKVYGASNPDLRQFDALGHKLIIYQGWSDQSVVPGRIVDYYDLAARTMGGMAKLQSFARLFMIPGMNHCYGGPATDAVDFLAALQDWVDEGAAPERLVGAHLKAPTAIPMVYHFPLAPPDVAYTRPLFPYPANARYAGSGDPNDAASFRKDDAR